MSIIKAITKNHFDLKEQRNWDRTYWFFDIHSTILKPNYTYGNIPDEFYPFAKETLQLISQLSDIVMCLYTCSHPNEIEEYQVLFKSHNINFKYVNENPEVETDLNGYGCYTTKPYMNVLFEDKSGFDPLIEWEEVYNLLLLKYPELKK